MTSQQYKTELEKLEASLKTASNDSKDVIRGKIMALRRYYEACLESPEVMRLLS